MHRQAALQWRGFVLNDRACPLGKNRRQKSKQKNTPFPGDPMHYFVTGATGFIGKRLVKKLLERKGAVVHFLIRKESESKVAELREYWGASATRAVPVFGDLTARKL